MTAMFFTTEFTETTEKTWNFGEAIQPPTPVIPEITT